MVEDVTVDVLVIGAGMSGLAAACRAADDGARVVVVEKNPHVGGNARISGAIAWTAVSLDVFLRESPESDPALAKIVVDNIVPALSWMEAHGVELSDEFDIDAIQGFATNGRGIDMIGWFDRARAQIEASGGRIAVGTTTEQLIVEDGAVVGAVVRDRDGSARISARATVIATGGFQGNPDMLAEYVHPNAGSMLLRSNPASTGDGIRLGLAAGASLSKGMNGFYGTVVGYPLNKSFQPDLGEDGIPKGPGDFNRLGQIYSNRTVLLDKEGRRFIDESRSYSRNGQAVCRQPGPRALLVADQWVRDWSTTPTQEGGPQPPDRAAEAARAGSHFVEAATLDELAAATAEWGYRNVREAIEAFNAAMDDESIVLDPPRVGNRRAFTQPPYFALEVQPAVTYTNGGLRINDRCQVLGDDDQPIPGLLAAGADAGGIYNGGYVGGLSMALTTGYTAGQTWTQAVGN